MSTQSNWLRLIAGVFFCAFAASASAQSSNPANSVQVKVSQGRMVYADPRTAAGHSVSVFKGGPSVSIRETPEWYRARVAVESEVRVKEKGFLGDSVLIPEGEYELHSPLIATVDGVDHVLLRGLISDPGEGWARISHLKAAIGDSDSYRSGWVLVGVDTGEVSNLAVVYRTTTNIFGKPSWNFTKPKELGAVAQVAIEVVGDEEAAGRLADAETSAVRQIGTTICSPSANFWERRGFTEGVSPDNGKIQVRVSDGKDEGKVIWSDPKNWQECE